MTQTNAQRLADELEQAESPYLLSEDRKEFVSELRRLDAIEQARDVAVEMAAQYAAERDQLRAELERLQKESEAVRRDAEKHAKHVSSAIQALETDYVLRNAINNALAFLRLIDPADAVKGGE